MTENGWPKEISTPLVIDVNHRYQDGHMIGLIGGHAGRAPNPSALGSSSEAQARDEKFQLGYRAGWDKGAKMRRDGVDTWFER